MDSFALSMQGQEEYRFKGKTIDISFKYIVTAAYLYMVIPITIFFMTWLRWYVGFPLTGLVIFALYCLIKKEYNAEPAIAFPVRNIVMGLIVLSIFLWMTGQGGFFFQYSDNHWRNATFFDLIAFDWPVIYEQTGYALVYYFLHWLVPALIGKLAGNLIIARMALFVWTLIGVLLVIILLSIILRAYSIKRFSLLLFMFISWSGINIIGGIISNVFGLIDFDLNTFGWWTNFNIDGQGYAYMFRSNCDQLASVYNQTIPPWLAVPLLINKPRSSTFVFLAACVFAYSPFPFVGIAMMMIFFFIFSLISSKSRKEVISAIKEPFGTANIIAFLTIVPVFLLYYSCNVAATTGAQGKMFGLHIPIENFKLHSLVILVLFCILQFGVYSVLIYNGFKNDALFKFITVAMCAVPLFKIGTMGDFCWNVSVPFFFLLMIYTTKYMYENINFMHGSGLIISKSIIGLIVCLSFSFLNPLSQIAFGFRIAYECKTVDLMCRGYIDTFSDKEITSELMTYNYLCPDYENAAFYKYIAK